jgi:hypothetical protein
MTRRPIIDTGWRVQLPRWRDLDEPERETCTTVVNDLGGSLEGAGEVHFRRYRAAEVCAYTLRARLGARHDVGLVAASRERHPAVP